MEAAKVAAVAETQVALTSDGVPAAFDHFDWIVVSISGGKDSMAALDRTVQLVPAALRSRIVCVYADLGRVVWKGTKELAASHAARFGLRFEVVTRDEDLIEHAIAKRATMDAKGQTDAPSWPSVRNSRWCTSDHKRGPIFTLFTKLAKELSLTSRKVRILDVQGLRADESSERKAMAPFKYRAEASNATKRDVWTWLPVHSWSEKMVKFRNARSGMKVHPAYGQGMERLSCCFCIYGSASDHMIAGKHNPELLAAYVAAEEQIRFPLVQGRSMKVIQLKLQSLNSLKEAA